MPAAKKFFISADQLKPIATGLGGCIASDRIMVDGIRVGYMYRQKPINDVDSGWCFLAGDESDEYMSDATRHGIYDVNDVANYDPKIIPLLDTEAPCAFERSSSGEFVAVTPNFEE